MHVSVVRLDVAGAALVRDLAIARTRGRCSGSAEIRRSWPGWRLTADLDGEAGVAVEALLWCHQANPIDFHPFGDVPGDVAQGSW